MGLTGLPIIGRFGLGRWDMADRPQQALVVESVDPLQSRQFDRLTVRPAPPVDHLGPVQAVDCLSRRVVVRIADAANRRFDARLGEAFGYSGSRHTGRRGWSEAKHRKFKRPFEPVRRAGPAAQAPVGTRIGGPRVRFRLRGRHSGAVRGYFSPIPGTGPSAALRSRGRIVASCSFRPRSRGRQIVTRLPQAARALRAGSALAPARRVSRSGRG